MPDINIYIRGELSISVDMSLTSYDSSITPVMGLVAGTLFPGSRHSGYIHCLLDVLGANSLTSSLTIPFPSWFGIEQGVGYAL